MRYLERIAWPAVQAEPILENERHLQQGELFHLMVQQHLVGVPVERLTAMAQGDADLAGWWQAYLAAAPADLPGQRFPEVTLSAPLGASGERRLVAKYDLVVLTPEGRAVIFDWKTSRQRAAAALAGRALADAGLPLPAATRWRRSERRPAPGS